MWIYPSSFLPPSFKDLRSACSPVLSNPHEDADRAVCSSLATQLQELLVWKGLIGLRQKFSVPRGFSIIFMTHHSYTCDAVLLQEVSLLRFVVLQRVLTAQMKGIGLNLILQGNLLCIIFLFFFPSWIKNAFLAHCTQTNAVLGGSLSGSWSNELWLSEWLSQPLDSWLSTFYWFIVWPQTTSSYLSVSPILSVITFVWG